MEEEYARRSELGLFFGWIAGLVITLVGGWGLMVLAFYLTRSEKQDPSLGLGLSAIFSLGMFLLLERNYWLSRLMGLKINLDFPWWASAIFFWLLGVPYLLFRSTVPQIKAASAREAKSQQIPQKTETTREVFETIVFVVVLVLLLKSFVAEAFVIPTGSMAETLYGYQKDVKCPQCNYEFPVNCSSEVEKKPPEPVFGCICPNCRYPIDFAKERMNPSCDTGDRVLVAKYLYDSGLPASLQRFDVVVFKFPEQAQKQHTPMNYIKRLIGLPRETIGILQGDLYMAQEDELIKTLAEKNLTYEDDDREKNLPERRRTRRNHEGARELLLSGNKCFQILRKPTSKIPAMSRIVYDNDHQAKDLSDPKFARWAPEKDEGWFSKDYQPKRDEALKGADPAWKTDGQHSFHHVAREGSGVDWLRYRNLLRPAPSQKDPRLEYITDFMGYNSANMKKQSDNWVGDLILECEVKIEKAEGKLVLELSKGVDRFQARWDLATGACTLVRLTWLVGNDGRRGVRETSLTPDGKATALKKPGKYELRFANVDERLTLWVNGDLVFGEGVEYDPPTDGDKIVRGPDERNDLEPASIGAEGADLRVNHLKLWRDTYYTNEVGSQNKTFYTFYVRPGHYFCLGDNSAESSDSRVWSETVGERQEGRDDLGGLVPENLMLGRALVIYWPLSRIGRIR